MLFASGQVRRLLATHPPLIERIQALDPSFQIKDYDRAVALAQRPLRRGASAVDELDLQTSALSRAVPAEPMVIAARVGNPQTIHVEHAAGLRADVPAAIIDAAASPALALPVLLASLLGRQPQVLAAQREIVERSFGTGLLPAVDQQTRTVAGLAPQLRLPVLQLLFPTLRRLTLDDRRKLLRTVDQLAQLDGQTDVFECSLALMLGAALNDELTGPRVAGTQTITQLIAPMAVVFSVLATHGSADATGARRAYESGLGLVLPRDRPSYRAIADWPQQFASALRALQTLHPYGKRALIEGLVKTIAHDEQLSTAEAELLRTVCAVLRCPLPPLLPRVAVAARSVASAG